MDKITELKKAILENIFLIKELQKICENDIDAAQKTTAIMPLLKELSKQQLNYMEQLVGNK